MYIKLECFCLKFFLVVPVVQVRFEITGICEAELDK